MEKTVQSKSEVCRGPLSLKGAVVHLRSSPAHSERGRLEEQELEIRSLQLALEAKLQENERWQYCIEALIENLEEGIIVSDEKGSVTLLNRQAEMILGLSRSQVLHKPLRQVWISSGLPPLPFSSQEHRGRVLHGQEIVLQDRSPLSSGVIHILSDVTRMMDLEEQVKTRQRVTAVGEMVGRVAHEIRNPLASIELFASLMGSTTHNDAERHRLAEQISMVVRTLDQLLSNLLVISGPPQLRIQEVSVEKLIQETVLMAMPLIRKRAILVREYLDPQAPKIEGDELMIRQCLLNILLNAVQASCEGGTIEIASQFVPEGGSKGSKSQTSPLRRGSPTLALSVRDFGIGIAPDDLPRLFDPFFSNRKGGTGLGLAIVRQIMEIHGGWINCESELGIGTTLQLCFPQGRKSE